MTIYSTARDGHTTLPVPFTLGEKPAVGIQTDATATPPSTPS
ncbi:MAG TPA: hypothetical protein VFG19_06750 [Geobacteraceae bacterium]|nr:hypothetical protein [Geobacteraceae bacterium]